MINTTLALIVYSFKSFSCKEVARRKSNIQYVGLSCDAGCNDFSAVEAYIAMVFVNLNKHVINTMVKAWIVILQFFSTDTIISTNAYLWHISKEYHWQRALSFLSFFSHFLLSFCVFATFPSLLFETSKMN